MKTTQTPTHNQNQNQTYQKGKIYVSQDGNFKKFDGRQFRYLCSVKDCQTLATVKHGKCKAHGGGRRCQKEFCAKAAVDLMFCKAHGGGKRCKVSGCKNSAADSALLCKSHGGGKRCTFKGCDRSAASRKLCIKHGGGKRCCVVGCSKSARSPGKYCYAHGGGKRCKTLNCNRASTKTGYCPKCVKEKGTTAPPKPAEVRINQPALDPYLKPLQTTSVNAARYLNPKIAITGKTIPNMFPMPQPKYSRPVYPELPSPMNFNPMIMQTPQIMYMQAPPLQLCQPYNQLLFR